MSTEGFNWIAMWNLIHYLGLEQARMKIYAIYSIVYSFYDIIEKMDSTGRDRMVIGFTTTCVISAYDH